jgi:hypothetical protein
VQTIATVNQIHFAGSSSSIVTDQLILAHPPKRYLGDPHQVPNVDNHFRMPNEESIHVRIALDRLSWHPTKVADIVNDAADPLIGLFG